ncbi:MAG: radical SAM protein [bacterium]|nr:radical SAM protein [bacterium]
MTRESAPRVPFGTLEAVWFQIGGTICNLRCHHCFISCAPDNDKFGFMSLAECRPHFEQAVALGAAEFYFTGGEPFANPDAVGILEAALVERPSTVLTNAMLIPDVKIERLAAAVERSGHTLEWRVSLDGYDAASNDPIRGPGAFDSTVDGIRRLVTHGFRPIVTMTKTWAECDDVVLARFREMCASIGYPDPRLKILPSLKLGAEIDRTGPYPPCAKVTHEMMADYDPAQLLCHSSRLVTDRGVWVCPILLDNPEARMADTLTDALRPYPLRHAACFTCYRNGAICSNSCAPNRAPDGAY